MKSLLAQHIEFRMKALGLNVKKLERSANLKVNAVKNILLGRSQNPNVYTVVAIAKALNCNLYELLGEHPPESAETPMILDPTHRIDHPALMKQCINSVLTFIETHSRSITVTQLMLIADHIYRYSLQTSSKYIDERFSEWIMLDRIGIGNETSVSIPTKEQEPA
jgi:transcriptional regulator with XRE-family HTH domain